MNPEAFLGVRGEQWGFPEKQEDDHLVIVAKSTRDLLEAMTTGVPSTVFVDAERIAGSVFKAICLRKISVCRYVNPGSSVLRSPICTEFATKQSGREDSLGVTRRP